MVSKTTMINLQEETEKLLDCMRKGDPCASIHLARLIEGDTQGVFQPFAEALAARLRDHLHRFAELNVTDPDVTLDDEVYQLQKLAAVDWDRIPGHGRPGEGASEIDFA